MYASSLLMRMQHVLVRHGGGGKKLFATTTAATLSSATTAPAGVEERIRMLRNFGISAHIDSGKTTLTERILFYTGRINQMNEVRGGGDKGATMDSMELEKERGITIQSAATYVSWKNHNFNIIDTPGHVDFTIEVERALRVLDGAILVVCSVGNVQSQTITVDRQMRRYGVPRIVFINKLDRAGANPLSCIRNLRSKLRLNVAAVQIPLWRGSNPTATDGTGMEGLVDLVRMRALRFRGTHGQTVVEEDVPEAFVAHATEMRAELLERLGEVDEEIGDLLIMDAKPTPEQIDAAIRRATLALKFIPVMMGSAYKNQGVQPLLDGVVKYLPNPSEVKNKAMDQDNGGAAVELVSDSSKPFVGLAFKLEDTKFGQLTYMRIYQGSIKRGDSFYNVNEGKRLRIPRLVRMHANNMEDIQEIGAGEICAVFGLECRSGDSFTSSPATPYTLTSMFVPDPVISLAIKPKKKDDLMKFAKALSKFTREDPTLRMHQDEESAETIISGMGELHLEIYVERLRREFAVETTVGQPQVAYRESLTERANFSYTHKKQSGGAGQFGRVEGYVEPLGEEDKKNVDVKKHPNRVEFVNNVIGGNIPTAFIPAVEKGVREACQKGSLIGFPVVDCRFVLTDGAHHAVDSNELSFRLAGMYAFRDVYPATHPIILEPLMAVTMEAPTDFQGAMIGMINKRKGIIKNTEQKDDVVVVEFDMPLAQLFGTSTELRSITQGKGEFSMEFSHYAAVPRDVQDALVKKYQAANSGSSSASGNSAGSSKNAK